MKRASLIAGLLLLPLTAYAQDVPLPGFIGTTAQEAFVASANGPVVADFHIFNWVWTSIIPPLDAAGAEVMTSLQNYVLGSGLPAIFLLYVLVFLFANLWHPSNPATVALGTIGTLMRFVTVMVIVGDLDHLNNWVVMPLKGTPAGILQAIGTVGGGQAIGANPGALFDSIVNLIWKANLTTMDHTSGFIQVIEIGLTVGIATIVELLFIGVAFLVFLLAYALLNVVLTLAPLMIMLAAFRQTKHLLAGWIGGCVSLIATIVLTNIMMQMALIAIHHIADPVAAAPDNANVSSMFAAVVETLTISVVMAGCVLQSRQLATGMFAGIMAGWEHFGASAGATFNSVSAAVAGAVAAAGASAEMRAGTGGGNSAAAPGGAGGGTATAMRPLPGASNPGPGTPGAWIGAKGTGP